MDLNNGTTVNQQPNQQSWRVVVHQETELRELVHGCTAVALPPVGALGGFSSLGTPKMVGLYWFITKLKWLINVKKPPFGVH